MQAIVINSLWDALSEILENPENNIKPDNRTNSLQAFERAAAYQQEIQS